MTPSFLPILCGLRWPAVLPCPSGPRGVVRRPAMALLAGLVLAGGMAAAPGAARAAPSADDRAFFEHAAACVAVLEREATELAGRYQAGDRSLKPALVKVTEHGFVFIGRSYLRGLREAEADRLLDQARQAQRPLAGDARARLVRACQSEGAELYADANALERALVSHRARARVDKLLARPVPPAAAASAGSSARS